MLKQILSLIQLRQKIKMFKQIDIKTHQRYEYLKHFTKNIPCTYSLCVDIDVTNIKNSSFKMYPVMIYLISKVLNRYENFKVSFDKDQNFGIFDFLSPSYTILNDDKSFSNIYTEFTDDFSLFYENTLNDMQKYKNKSAMFPQKKLP